MEPVHSSMRLPRSTPEAQGIPTSAILAFLDDVDEQIFHLHSVMLLRHGYVVAEGWWKPYSPELPHMLYSLSKSFTSSAIGLAVDDGLLSIEDTVLSFFPDEKPSEVNEHLAEMRVKHLLSMNTGHDDDTTSHLRNSDDENWVRAFLTTPVIHKPGTHFLYNSGATYMLSAIIQKLTGMTLLEYLRPRLFEPLGIRNPSWQSCPMGVNTGGWGLSITTEDIACFGQMLLQNGLWNGERVLPEEWIELASSFHSDNSSAREEIDWQQGYGFQFWLCRHNAYRGDGAFGQFCVVMPEQDAVFVTTAGVKDMQAVLNLVWKHLLPAMESGALPENLSESYPLQTRLGELSIPACDGETKSAREASLSGKRLTLEPNPFDINALSIEFQDDACVVEITDPQGKHAIACGRGEWKFGKLDVLGMSGGMVTSDKVAGSAYWKDDAFVFNLLHYETPHQLTFRCTVDGDRVEVAPKLNVSFEEDEIPPIAGRVE